MDRGAQRKTVRECKEEGEEDAGERRRRTAQEPWHQIGKWFSAASSLARGNAIFGTLYFANRKAIRQNTGLPDAYNQGWILLGYRIV